MDQPMNGKRLSLGGTVFSLPQPIFIDLKAVPKLPCFTGVIALKIKEVQAKTWHFHGAKIMGQITGEDAIATVFLVPEPHQMKIEIFIPDYS